MPEGGISLGELGRRMSVLEREHEELRELVDGHESWSHRNRLHKLDNFVDADRLLQQALSELRSVRRGKWALMREWVAVLVAAAAVAVAVWAKLHGG